MKELLYLKDEQIKDFIQLLFYAYRETFSDPKEILAKNSFGPAHLRALNLIERNPGTNLGELMFQLKITKQSLNRVLRDLLKSRMIKQIKDEEDTRKKNLFLDKEGKIFFEKIYGSTFIGKFNEIFLTRLRAKGGQTIDSKAIDKNLVFEIFKLYF